jgi:hypothetical protein
MEKERGGFKGVQLLVCVGIVMFTCGDVMR